MINIQEYHERIKNKRTEINNFTSVERNLQQKLDIALKKLDDDKVSTYVCNFMLVFYLNIFIIKVVSKYF